MRIGEYAILHPDFSLTTGHLHKICKACRSSSASFRRLDIYAVQCDIRRMLSHDSKSIEEMHIHIFQGDILTLPEKHARMIPGRITHLIGTPSPYRAVHAPVIKFQSAISQVFNAVKVIKQSRA